MEFTKVCTICQKELPATKEYFHKKITGKYGFTAKCKSCALKYNRLMYKKHRDKILESKRIENIEKSDRIKQRRKEQYIKHRNQRLLDVKNYQQKNKEKIRKKVASYTIKRYHSDINFKLKMNLSRRVRQFIYKEGKRTIDMIGCSINDFKKHLESLFKDGMSWDNYGKKGWQIDHILPCTSFDLNDFEQQKKCFHYTNLQPLWAEDNLRKSNKIL